MKRTIRMLILGISVILLLGACSSGPSPTRTPFPTYTPIPTATPTAEPTTPAEPTPVPIEEPEYSTEIATYYYGAATASVEERIYLSDVVVVAQLVSDSDGVLTFRALEYLKGTGPNRFTLPSSAGRNTKWDNRDAVLFLTTGSDTAATGQGNTARDGGGGANTDTSPTFQFTDTTNISYDGKSRSYIGDLPEGHTVDSENPVWLPSESSGTSGGGSGTRSVDSNTNSDTYRVNDGSDTITLSDLKARLAWVYGGDGVEGYQKCVRLALGHDRDARDYEAYSGESAYPTPDFEKSVLSSDPAGTLIVEFTHLYGADYDIFWLDGPDEKLFRGYIDDDDSIAGNGYDYKVVTKRPIPAGTYRFQWKSQDYLHVPCNYKPDREWPTDVVISTAPAGTLYEAFFDPVSIGAAVGADGTNGVLRPTAFTIGGVSTTLQSLKWQGTSVALELGTAASLTGYALDFIALDGSVSLSLDASSATVSGSTLTWTLATQPWQDGDKLMLRIRDVSSAPPTRTPEP